MAKKKRGVMKLWLAIVLAVVGLVAIAGTTVLIMFLLGNFKEKVVPPENIAVETTEEFVDGLASFDADASSLSDQNNRRFHFNASSNFSIVISTTTEDVTTTELTLSELTGGSLKNGKWENGYIRIPQKAKLGEKIEIELLTDADLGDVFGGYSIFTVRSANALLAPVKVSVSTDVSVRELSLKIAGREGKNDNGPEEVLRGDFRIEANFTPEESQKNFSNPENQKRVFFSAEDINLECLNAEEGLFRTKDVITTSHVDRITAYTFSNAFYQNQVLAMFSEYSGDELATRVIQHLVQNPQKCKTSFIDIKVVPAEIDKVKFSGEETTKELEFENTIDKYFELTLNSNKGDDSLNMTITDKSGKDLSSLFSSVGIKIPRGAEFDNLLILGGNVMKVATVNDRRVISVEPFDSSKRYWEDLTAEYYVLPNTSPSLYENYYWRIADSNLTARSFDLKLNLFYQDDDTGSEWTTFFDIGTEGNFEPTLHFQSTMSAFEYAPTWTQNNPIRLTINYGEDGTPKPDAVDLKNPNIYGGVSNDNVYKTVKFFLFCSAGTDLTTIFDCENPKVYALRNEIYGLPKPDTSEGGVYNYTLYGIDGTILTALKSCADNIYVVAAVVRTDVNGKLVTAETGDLQIVVVSRPLQIEVDNALPFFKLAPSFDFDGTASIAHNVDTGDYYVPSVYVDDDGNKMQIIKFNMTLESENRASDIVKIRDAFNSSEEGTERLKVVCKDINNLETTSVVMQVPEVKASDLDENLIEVTANFYIADGDFNRGDAERRLKFELQYINEFNEEFYKKICKNGEETVESVVVYYPEVVAMKGAYEERTDLDRDDDGQPDEIKIVDDIDKATISWGNWEKEGTTLDAILNNTDGLNALLSFALTDQHGLTIQEKAGLYDVQFVEIPRDANSPILNFDSANRRIQGFNTSEDLTTTLKVRVVDRDGQPVMFGGEEISREFSFNVSCTGIDHIKFDNTLTDVDAATRDSKTETFVLNELNGIKNNGNVTVTKYATVGVETRLSNLFDVFLDEAEEQRVSNLKFTLADSFYNGMSLDILKVFGFATATDVTEGHFDTKTNTGDDYSSLRDAIQGEVFGIVFYGYIQSTITIEFNVTDASERLFNIQFRLVCRPCASLDSTFSRYSQGTYADYLKTTSEDNRQPAIFADEKYSLDEYIPISWIGSSVPDVQPSWTTILNGVDDLGQYFECNSLNVALAREESAGGNSYHLNVGRFFQLQTIQFTIFCGQSERYSLRTTITLYVNPNFVIVQKVADEDANMQVDLQSLSSSLFDVFKVTGDDGYVEKRESATSIKNQFTYANTTGAGLEYVTLTLTSGNIVLGVNTNQLNMKLGEKILQTFVMQTASSTGDPINVDAVKVKTFGEDEEKVERCSEATFAFDIGFGDNAYEMAQKLIKKGDGKNVETVAFNEKETIVLQSGLDYTVGDTFSIERVSGNINWTEGKTIRAKTLSKAFFNPLDGGEGNTVVVKTTIDGKLSVLISLNAIVSQVGEVFVKYDQPDEETREDVFNKFGDVDFAELVGASVTNLEENGVYQQLSAGKTYKILHNIAKADTSDKDENGKFLPGLYYYAETDTEFNLTLSVVGCVGYIDGLASLTNRDGTYYLTINDLKNDTESDVFVVVRATVSSVGKTPFVWNFRIKVQSNLEGGSVAYPYADNVEYLDTNSTYYVDGQYHINLQEQLVETNSKFKTDDEKKRFADPDFGDGRDVQIGFKIASARIGDSVATLSVTDLQDLVESCSLDLSGGESARVDSAADFDFDIKLKSNLTRLTLEIAKFYYVDGNRALSSTDLSYVFKFNQSPSYKASVTTGGQSIVGVDNVFAYNVKAGSGENVFNITLSELSGTSENAEGEFWAYAKSLSGNLSDAISGGVDFEGRNGAGVLKFTPQNSVAKDSVVEFGIYTKKKVAFKLIITVTGPYDITETGAELKGGKIYRLAELLSIKGTDGRTIPDASVSTFCANDAPTTYFVNTSGAGQIGFANLTADTTFKFVFTISGYSFEREFVVKASVDSGATYTHKDTEKRYGGKEFSFDITGVQSDIPTNEDSTFTYKIWNGSEFSTSVNITPTSIGEEQPVSQSFTIGCFNGDNELFRITLIYNYTVFPNVETTLHYPAPNGTELEENAEYLSDNTTIENFFGSKAQFNAQNRVVVNVVDEAGITETNWKITVDANSINNLQLTYGDGRVVTNQSTTGELVLCDGDEAQARALGFTFKLVDASKTGSIDFVVSVNSVEKVYRVVVLTGKVIDLQLNSPSSSKERFYAEDLKRQADAKIFAPNRILKYAFNEQTAASGGATYYARLASSTDVQAIAVYADNTAMVVQDLEKSYEGYTYQGTFLSRAEAENLSNTQNLDETIYATAPRLTARVAAIYRTLTRDIEIDLQKAGYAIKLNGTDSKDVAISVKDLSKEIKYEPKLYQEDEIVETSSFTYSVEVSLKFNIQVTSDDPNSDTKKIILKADNEYVSFLDTYAQELGITDENGETMTARRMQEIGASFDIQIYGASIALQQNAGSNDAEKKLTNNALSIHNRLLVEQYTSSAGLKYRYTTGLIPRAKCTLSDGFVDADGGETLTNRLNYITLTAVSNGSDWTIRAQGSNNNGNHVMLRLDYVVDLGGGNVAKESHNLLFLVEPNTTLTFASDAQGEINTAVVAQDYDAEGDKLITSNRAVPYKVDFNMTSGESFDINLFGGRYPVINVMLHGSTINTANTLTYKYTNTSTEIAGKTYNDKTSTFLSFVTGWSGYQTSNGAESVAITAKSTTFGSANFYIEFEDEFEFKMRFYFTIISRSNPTLKGEGTINEGDTLRFGARYSTLKQNMDNGDFMVVGSFNYAVEKSPDDVFTENIPDTEKYNNYVKFTNNTTYAATLKIVVKDSERDYVNIFDPLSAGETKIYQVFYEEAAWVDGTPTQANIKTVEVRVKFEQSGNEFEIGTYSVEYGNNAKEQKDPYFDGEEDYSEDETNNKNVEFENGVAKTDGFIRNNRGTDETSQKNKYNTKKFYVSSTLLTNYSKNTISDPDTSTTDAPTGGTWSYVVLGGMDIVGFNTDLTDTQTTRVQAVNQANLDASNNIVHSTFDINSLTVTKISFVVNNKVVSDNSTTIHFVTSDQFSYYSGSTLKKGTGQDDSGVTFKIPKFDGNVWGTQETINLTINFTLSYGGNSTTISEQYVLNRKDEGKELFTGATNLVDNGEVVVQNTNGKTVYNDTLEVKLDSKESVDLVVLDKDAYAFEDNGELIYIKQTSDESLQDGKSYYNVSGSTVTRTTGLGTYERFVPSIVSLSNQRSYAVREYIGINKNVQANGRDGMLTSTSGEQFYVLATNHKRGGEDATGLSLAYNGTDLTTVASTTKFGTSADTHIEKLDGGKGIAKYTTANQFQLRINHIDELAGRDHKTTQLFFLYTSGSNTYRYEQAFNIYPQYSSVRTGRVDNSVDVTSYIQAGSSTSPYYIFPLSAWGGSGVSLVQYDAVGGGSISGLRNDDYKLKFAISENSLLGYGQANIDARGLITTVEGFSLDTQTISVNVYMRVAGENGLFESEDTSSTPIGTLTLHFTTASSYSSTTSGIVSAGNSVFAVDGQARVFGSISTSSPRPQSAPGIMLTSVVGERLDFAKAFEGSFPDLTNKKFKLLKDGDNAVKFNSSQIQDNDDGWVFSTPGERTVTIGLSARNGGTDVVGYFTATVIVQDSSRKKMSFAVANSAGFDPSKIASGSGKWYKQAASSNSAKEVSSSDKISDNVGLYDFTYIQASSGKSTSYDVSFYVYNRETIKYNFAAIQPGGAFVMQNLLTSKTAGSTYEFWKLDENGMLTELVKNDILSSDKSEGQTETRQYCLVEKNSRKEVTDVQLFEVTFKYITMSISQQGQATVGLEEGRILSKDDVCAEVEQLLGLSISNLIENYSTEKTALSGSTEFISIQERNSATGVLSYVTDFEVPNSLSSLQRTYVVTYRVGGTLQIKLVQIYFSFS